MDGDDLFPSLGTLAGRAQQPPPPLNPASGAQAAGVVPQHPDVLPPIPSLHQDPGDFSLGALQRQWQEDSNKGWEQRLSEGLGVGFGPGNIGGAGMAGILKLARLGKPDWGGMQQYMMMNEAGHQTGELHAEFVPPDRVHVHWLGADQGVGGLGPANVRSLVSELLREYPEMRTISMDRASGARFGPAAHGQSQVEDLRFLVPGHIQAAPANQWSHLYFNRGEWLPWEPSPPRANSREQGLRDFYSMLFSSARRRPPPEE